MMLPRASTDSPSSSEESNGGTDSSEEEEGQEKEKDKNGSLEEINSIEDQKEKLEESISTEVSPELAKKLVVIVGQEIDDVLNESNPEFVSGKMKLMKMREDRIKVTKKNFDLRIDMLEKQRSCEKQAIQQNYEEKLRQLKKKMLNKLGKERSLVCLKQKKKFDDRDKKPKESKEESSAELEKRRREENSLERTILENQKKRRKIDHGIPVSVLNDEDLNADLTSLGILGLN